jgi:hypothetical protein
LAEELSPAELGAAVGTVLTLVFAEDVIHDGWRFSAEGFTVQVSLRRRDRLCWNWGRDEAILQPTPTIAQTDGHRVS